MRILFYLDFAISITSSDDIEMLLSGFTFIRNALKYDFPIVEAIQSMLPLVDELIINVGKSDDGTEQAMADLALQASGQNGRIRLIHSVWDDTKTDSGLVLSEQTNLALAECKAPWALYLQADEAIHEGEHQLIRNSILKNRDESIEAFRFRYLHFYGGYTLVQRPWNWYPSEIRLIRTGRGIQSFGDAQTFRGPQGSILKSSLLPAHIFHYGHSREPEKMKRKIHYFHRFWHGDQHKIAVDSAYNINWKSLVWFWGTHPISYRERIRRADWSPLPSDLPEGPAPQTTLILAGKSISLAMSQRSFLETRNIKVLVAEGLWDFLRSALLCLIRGRAIGLVDLEADQRGLFASIVYGFIAIIGFKYRVAHAPSGNVRRGTTIFYHYISWGHHEKSEQGFIVPEKQYESQIAKWLGLAV